VKDAAVRLLDGNRSQNCEIFLAKFGKMDANTIVGGVLEMDASVLGDDPLGMLDMMDKYMPEPDEVSFPHRLAQALPSPCELVRLAATQGKHCLHLTTHSPSGAAAEEVRRRPRAAGQGGAVHAGCAGRAAVRDQTARRALQGALRRTRGGAAQEPGPGGRDVHAASGVRCVLSSVSSRSPTPSPRE
jgi:hypothetical protein